MPSSPSGPASLTWTPADTLAGLLPSAPGRRFRAWERQPLPSAGGKKIWRRVAQGGIKRVGATEQADAFEALQKKAVKKMCLQNEYGREWRVTQGEGAGGRIRKRARPLMVLRSGTKVDPNFEGVGLGEGIIAAAAAKVEGEIAEDDEDDEEDEDFTEGEDEGARGEEEAQAEPTTDSEWEDVDSDDGASVGGVEDEEAADAASGSLAQVAEPESVTEELIDSPQSEAHKSPTKRSPKKQSPAKRSPSKSKGKDIPAEESVAPDEIASPSAPAEAPKKEEKYRPRLSDDTAILHAFLDRAAAKKPSVKRRESLENPSVKRRESLENRRDSDIIKQALASPAKPEVLAELDANSPLPNKAARHEAVKDEEPTSPKKKEKQIKVSPPTSDGEDSRPARRSSRSRAKPALLLNQPTEAPKTGPSKITIRGPVEATPLKRSEVQELAAATRNNTRKNKGQAIFPLERLARLANEKQSPAKNGATASNSTSKNVRWDQTLEYWSAAPEAFDEAEAASPGKKSRKSRRTAPALPSEPSEPAQLTLEEPAPTAQQKRKSRIATPAKRSVRAAPVEDTAPPPVSKLPARAGGIPTPKRLRAPGTPAAPKELPAAPAPPSAPVFAPRLTSGSFEDALRAPASPAKRRKLDANVAPGLVSPAKRRVRDEVGSASLSGTGAGSPSKRRR